MPDLISANNDDEPSPAFIEDINNESIANVFCFGAFANKNTGVVYNNSTGNFPFMSLDGNVCLFVIYHYKTNAIFVMLIAGLNSLSILYFGSVQSKL
jgi:hypothetical protein